MGRKNAATALDSFDKACNIGPLEFVWSAQALTSQPGHSCAARSVIDGGMYRKQISFQFLTKRLCTRAGNIARAFLNYF